MTTRDQARKLLDALPDSKFADVVRLLASRARNGAELPAQTTQPTARRSLSFSAIDDGSPDNASERVEKLMAEIIDRRHPRSEDERCAREFLIGVADGVSGLDLERLRSVRDRAWRVEAVQADGRVVLAPDSTEPYPTVRPGYGGRGATADEFAAFEAEHGPFLPPDGEG